MRLSYLLFLSALFFSCDEARLSQTEILVTEFYSVYSERQDFEKFIEFYNEDIVLEDIITGERIEGKENLKSFFDWNNPDFELLEKTSLVVSDIIIDRKKAVIKGYFTKFSWGGYEFDAMHFTTLLTFNESGKIIHQVDWINYPSSLVDYSKRKNSNTWIDQ